MSYPPAPDLALGSSPETALPWDAPPYSFTSLTTHDIDELAEATKGWDQSYRQLSPGQFKGHNTYASFGGLQLYRETTQQAYLGVGTGLPNCYVLGVPLQMEGTGRLLGECFDRPDQLLVMDVGSELHYCPPACCDIVVVAIPAEKLQRAAAELDQWQITETLQGRVVLSLPPKAVQHLSTVLTSALNQLAAAPARLGYAQTQQLLEGYLIEQVLACLKPLAPPHLSDPPLGTKQYRAVTQACDYIEAHPQDAITVSQLCTLTGVSRRTLQAGFQSQFGVSPKQYLTTHRLNGVRRDLLATNSKAASVTDIATAWGFFHVGHFASSYKAMFGELPSQTLGAKR